MASFATYDELEGRYILKGIIPAQETLRASETICWYADSIKFEQAKSGQLEADLRNY